ncbi:LuxR C-terminal-related transcriptional regulator [uncultured Desulfuromusa sp.]|uniref:helix-turn-helix transcriptional regulator n=1 Tax=uncultured Desulfuromusa sp. TaxID=219183 RepID=UPI002AA8BD34|nr:LuxR C-terminal-related transcriptional regulator [uncultured Desulfuromusa sp.]
MITSFPEEWEKHYIEKKYFDWDNVAYVAFRHQGLIHWDDCQNLPALSQKRNQRSKRILGEAASIGLKEGWLFSMPGRKTTEFTILSVASEDIDKSIRTKTILDYVSPHLALAVSSTVMSQRPLPAQLTKREKEVLSWVAAGKTAWEISEIIKVSRRTVEFHISNILAKLDAVNSQQAIAIALSSGLINY